MRRNHIDLLGWGNCMAVDIRAIDPSDAWLNRDSTHA